MRQLALRTRAPRLTSWTFILNRTLIVRITACRPIQRDRLCVFPGFGVAEAAWKDDGGRTAPPGPSAVTSLCPRIAALVVARDQTRPAHLRCGASGLLIGGRLLIRDMG